MKRCLLVLSLLGAQSTTVLADAIQMTVPARKPGTPDVPEVEGFVFRPDPYRSGTPPRWLDPAKVGAYLATMLDKTTPQRALEHAETVAVFYDASEIAAPLFAFLDKADKTADDRRRSIAFARIVAQLGTDKEVAGVESYFVYLCGRTTTEAELEDLVRLYAVLATSVDVKPLNDAIRARAAVLAGKTDHESGLQGHKLDDLLSRIEGVKLAKAAQAKILAITDRAARLRALVEMYLGIEATSHDLRPWAAARLRRETWAEQPPQNGLRPARPTQTKTVIKAFRAAMATVAKQPADEREFLKIRSLRAIAFFGGALSAGERKYLSARTTQSDILAYEGFMIPPRRR